jgi:hypothetical protein
MVVLDLGIRWTLPVTERVKPDTGIVIFIGGIGVEPHIEITIFIESESHGRTRPIGIQIAAEVTASIETALGKKGPVCRNPHDSLSESDREPPRVPFEDSAVTPIFEEVISHINIPIIIQVHSSWITEGARSCIP